MQCRRYANKRLKIKYSRSRTHYGIRKYIRKKNRHAHSHTRKRRPTQSKTKIQDLYNGWKLRANKYFRWWFLYFCGLFFFSIRVCARCSKKRKFKTLIFIELSIVDGRFAYRIFLTHYARRTNSRAYAKADNVVSVRNFLHWPIFVMFNAFYLWMVWKTGQTMKKGKRVKEKKSTLWKLC